MKKITEELITEAMENGFTREDAERGYGVLHLIMEMVQNIYRDLIA